MDILLYYLLLCGGEGYVNLAQLSVEILSFLEVAFEKFIWYLSIWVSMI